MGPALTVVQRATVFFADPLVRPQLAAWLEEGVPFLEMIDRLGFSDLVDQELRAALERLSPEEVAIISNAALIEIARLGNAESATLPIECTLASVTGPVDVTAGEVGGRPVAVVAER